jgi:hypothetical protein
MNASMLLALALGTVIPLLTGLVTKATVSPRLKLLLSGLVTGLAGGLSAAYSHPPNHLGQWEQVGITVLMAWMASAAAFVEGSPQNAVTKAITDRTSRFGFGPRVAA